MEFVYNFNMGWLLWNKMMKIKKPDCLFFYNAGPQAANIPIRVQYLYRHLNNHSQKVLMPYPTITTGNVIVFLPLAVKTYIHRLMCRV